MSITLVHQVPINRTQYQYMLNKIAYITLRKRFEPKCRTVLFASHNSRIRCFVESVIDKKVYDMYRRTDPYPEAYRFKNCAIISIRIRQGCPNATIELVYSGHIDDQNRQKGMYLVSPSDTSISKSNRDRVFETQDVPLKNMNIDMSCIDGDLELLIIRHAEAEHNIKSYYKVPIEDTNENTIVTAIKDNKLDTDLTSNGREDTKKAASFIETYLKEKSMHRDGLDYVLCSVLKRTRQTLDIILREIKGSGLCNRINKMVVAPCSKEIKYGKSGECFVRDPEPYSANPSNDPIDNIDIRFNQPYCSFLTFEQSQLPLECQKISDYTIDPTYYIDYQKNSKCLGIASNMVKIVIDVIKEIDCENK